MHDHHWTFGRHCHIRFPSGGAPVVDTDHGFTSNEGSAAISDASGNLLFYTDGTTLYDAAHFPYLYAPLGGSSSSTHSAIIVPPAGGGLLYHMFTVFDWDSGAPNVGPVNHITVKLSGGLAVVSGPTPLTFGPQRAAEKLAAIPHVDCDKYWLVTVDVGSDAGGGNGNGTERGAEAGKQAATAATSSIHVMLIASDQGPLASTAYPFAAAAPRGCIKFSPDGSMLAIVGYNSLEILTFDRATGVVAHHSRVTNWQGEPYGVEFSPNGLYLYLSNAVGGEIARHKIGGLTATDAYSSLPVIGQWTQTGLNGYRVGALQLAPNGKIYGTKNSIKGLFEIGAPDSPTATGTATQFDIDAKAAGGATLTLNNDALLGLPTFVRIASDCRCDFLAAQIDGQLAAIPKVNALRPCDDSQPVEQPKCLPIDLPRIAPWTSIRWGDSECDCIEGDDTEIMHLTVCNPYQNLTLSNLVINQIIVVDMNGNPPPLLPDGTPSVQLVPVGPYCFDDLAPCTCVTRQFVLRLRGAVPGPYRILLKGICFDACFQGDEEDCFIFNVCKD